MREKKNAIYRLFILVITVITSLTAAKVEAGERFFDSNGNGYNTVTKGGKVWMRDNLNVTKYRNGEEITYAETTEEWLDATAKGEGAWCYYNETSSKAKTYGRLYNWFAVNDPRGLAPEGWHIPSYDELKSLATALAGEPVPTGKRSPAVMTWRYPDVSVDNVMHFNAIPGGVRDTENGIFKLMNEESLLWSGSAESKTHAWAAQFNFRNSEINLNVLNKKDGASVRCVKD